MNARITQIKNEAEDIRSFRLEKGFDYLPGQWMYVKLNSKFKIQNSKHHFTISSSPTEACLQFTTKFRAESEYKRALWEMKEGDEFEINGPFGSFVLEEKDATPRLFIAGGIGITPFRSMIKYAADKQLQIPITLLYSGKNEGEMAFASELANFFTPSVSPPNLGGDKRGGILKIVETEKEGRLDQEKIKKYCQDWKERSWWVCGPPAMVEAMVEMGQEMGVEVSRMRSEEFTGY